MRSDAPPLLPILRSRHQAELLTHLLLHPEQEYSLTELGRLLDTPPTTIHREVERLAKAGIVTERRVGRARLVRANSTNRYLSPLTELVTLAFGPELVVGEEFQSLPGSDAAAIYGSWAARYEGEAGPPPRDVDVLVIGSPDRGDLYEAAERVEQRLSLPVNPTVCSRQRWVDGDDAFVRQLKLAPLVWVLGTDPSDEAA